MMFILIKKMVKDRYVIKYQQYIGFNQRPFIATGYPPWVIMILSVPHLDLDKTKESLKYDLGPRRASNSTTRETVDDIALIISTISRIILTCI